MCPVAAETMALSSAIAADAGAPRAPAFVLRPEGDAAALGRIASACDEPLYALAKRTLDLVCAAVLLVALLPVFALVGLAIVLESRGPVFYCAERIGRFGRPFCVAKFRSMRADADPEAHAAFIGSLMREEARCAVYKVPGDPRITRVGAFLRRTSLDELPQLWNVLRGEMSLVGPRPDVPYALAQYPDWVGPRLVVKPGITGLWQVSGRSTLSLLDMYRLDVRYVQTASLLGDLRILVRTVPAVLSRTGAA